MKHTPTAAAVIAGILLVLATVRGNAPPQGEPAKTSRMASAAPVMHGIEQQTGPDDGPRIQHAIWYYEREDLGRTTNYDI